MASEVALTALPGAGAAKAATKMLPAALSGGWVRKAALEGAAGGAAGAAVMGDDIGGNAGAGALLGPTLAGLWRGASGAMGGLQNVLGGAEGQAVRDLRRVFGDRTDEAVAKLRALRGGVPGEAPTAGMAASARLPELKVLEEGARSRPGANAFLERDVANQGAREQVLENIAEPGRRYFNPQTGEVDLSTAQALRKRATDPLYEMAGRDTINLNPQLTDILAGAEIQPAARRAGMSFQQGQTNDLVAGRSPASSRTFGGPSDPGIGRYLPEVDAYAARHPFMPNYGQASVDDLQRLKNEIGKDISTIGNANDSAANVRRAQLTEARQQLDAAMREQSGAYGTASTVYKNLSAPQNQADVAQSLLEALRSPAGVERATSFMGAMRNAPNLIKNATGQQRFSDLGQVMSRDQMAGIRGLENSVQREADYAALSANKGMVPEYLSPMEKVEEAIPGFLSKSVTALRKGLKLAGKRSDEAVQKVVDQAMLDPSKLAGLLESLPPTERSKIMNYLRNMNINYGGVAGTMAVGE